MSIQAYYKAYLPCFLNIILFRIVCTENQLFLPLFMINKVNVTLLRQFLGLYCLSKLIILLKYDVFSISLLFRIVSRQNQFHLPLFMINMVNVTLLRQFLALYCLYQAYYKAYLPCFLNIIFI